MKAQYWLDPESKKESAKAQYWLDPECKESAKTQYWLDQESKKDSVKAYYDQNRELILASKQDQYQAYNCWLCVFWLLLGLCGVMS